MKMCGGRGGITAPLTLALDKCELSASHTCCFTPGKRPSGTHRTGGWVGPRASLEAVEKKKIPCPCQELSHSHPACTQLLYWPCYHSSSIMQWVVLTLSGSSPNIPFLSLASPMCQHWIQYPACLRRRVYWLHESWDKATQFPFTSCVGV
jgi:hypothetical protein